MSNEFSETSDKVIDQNNISWVPQDLARNLDKAFAKSAHNIYTISDAICEYIALSHNSGVDEKDQDRIYQYIEHAVANYINEHAVSERQYFDTWMNALYLTLQIKDVKEKYTPTDLAIRLLPHLYDLVGIHLPQDDYLRPKITNIFDQMLPPINNNAQEVLSICALVLVRTHPEYPLHENAKKQFILALQILAKSESDDAFDIFSQNIVFFHRMAHRFSRNETTKASILEALESCTNEAFDIMPRQYTYLRMCMAIQLATNLPRSSPIAVNSERIFDRDFKRCMANEDGLSIIEHLWQNTGDYSEHRTHTAVNPGFVYNVTKKQKDFAEKMKKLEELKANKAVSTKELRRTVKALTVQNHSLEQRLEEIEKLLKKVLSEVGKPQKTKRPKRRKKRDITVVQDVQFKK
jgi:hypothetical protein